MIRSKMILLVTTQYSFSAPLTAFCRRSLAHPSPFLSKGGRVTQHQARETAHAHLHCQRSSAACEQFNQGPLTDRWVPFQLSSSWGLSFSTAAFGFLFVWPAFLSYKFFSSIKTASHAATSRSCCYYPCHIFDVSRVSGLKNIKIGMSDGQ